MNDLIHQFLLAIFIGIGSTLTFDSWALFLKVVFNITPSNICLVGRWLRYMPEGKFKHTNITSSPGKSGECIVGWIAHYIFGISFAIIFILLVGDNWIQNPKIIPAIIYGVATVFAPFCIMQPSFGFGLAASKASNPKQARIRTLMNHTAFGIGLYLFALLVNLIRM